MPGPAFLHGDVVDLHTIDDGDLDFLQRKINDPRIWRNIGRPGPVNDAQERAFYEEVVSSEETVNLVVCVDGDPVGVVGLHDVDESRVAAELGYWIAPDHHRNGYGTEAVGLLVGYGFAHLRLHRVEARVFGFNDASRRLLEGLGFTHEGTHREAEFVDGEYQDTYWYGLLREEWDGEDALAGAD